MVDAVIFTIIVGMLVVNVLLPSIDEVDPSLNPSMVHDDLLLLRFNAAGIYPELGNISLSVAELAALQISKGMDESFLNLIDRCMEALLGKGVGWMIVFEYRQESLSLGTLGYDQREDIGMTLRSVIIPTGEAVTSKLYC